MASPFPGMDPYLEAHWRDIHSRLIIYACDALQSHLPGGLRARVEESVLLETPAGIGDHPLFPDVRVVEYAMRRVPGAELDAGVVLAEPLVVDVEPETVTEPFIQIIDRESGNRVVTVIEFLSPSNKSPGANREQYLRKQHEVCSSDANLVEIDLNRFGIHTLAFPLTFIKARARTSYMACVRRANRRGKAEVYLMWLWERLPTLKIPLRATDVDVPLDLQALVEQCYRNGAYEGTLHYAAPPDPPLLGAEKEWVDNWLFEKGLRTRKPPKGRGSKPKPR
jgi:hypothetical protein